MSLILFLLASLYVSSTNEAEDIYDDDDVGYIPKDPKSLAGKSIKIVTLKNPPLSNVLENGTGEGIVFEIVKLLQKRYGFKYDASIAEENILGDREKGIMGMLHQGKAEMGAAFLPWFPEFADYNIRYSVGILESDWVVLLRRPQSSASGSGLLAPFDETVWYLILAAVICTGPVFYVLLFVRFWLVRDQEGKESLFSVGNCVWFVYGALMKQGSTLSPTSDSSRVLFATWWIFITILTSFYTANLTAFLTLSKFTLPINDAKDIAKNRYKWLAREGSALDYVINMNPDFEYLNISYRSGYGEISQKSDLEMLAEVEKFNKMYLREKSAVEHLIMQDYYTKAANNVEEKDRCTYVMTPNPFMTQIIAFAYYKHTDLSEYFDPVLQTLVETGIMKYLMRRNLPNIQICPLNLGSKERQLRNADLWMTYMVVVTGFSTSIAVFMAEMLVRLWRYCSQKEMAKMTATTYPGDWKTGMKKSHILNYPPMMAREDNSNFTRVNSKDRRGAPTFLFQYSA